MRTIISTKKILFVLLALTISQSAIAEWISIGEGANSTNYLDPNRIESYSGVYQSIWILTDYKTTQQSNNVKTPFRSTISRFAVDCSRREIRLISGFWYSENMGKGGRVDSTNSQTPFTSAPPNSTAEILVTVACKK
jgi:hypothetical protein